MGKKEKDIGQKTKRLVLKPNFLEEGEEESERWTLPWDIVLRETGESIGTFSFGGLPQGSVAEARIEIKPEYEGRGYAEEAMEAMTDLAFYGGDGVFYIEANASEAGITRSELESLGFRNADGRWIKQKPKVFVTGMTFALGIVLGTIVGLVFKAFVPGIVTGGALGALLGVIVDAKEKAGRKRARDERDSPSLSE